jgi:hypothetical protein
VSDDEPEVIDVMLGDLGGKPMNTLMLERTDVVVPLERDLDGDPLQDDEVLLCTEDGMVIKRLYSSDDDVEEDADNRMLLYRFKDLRYGVYSIWTKIGGNKVEVLRGLVVRKEGVFMNGEALGEEREGPGLAPEPDHAGALPDEPGTEDDADPSENDGDGDDADVDQSEEDTYGEGHGSEASAEIDAEDADDGEGGDDSDDEVDA